MNTEESVARALGHRLFWKFCRWTHKVKQSAGRIWAFLTSELLLIH